MDLKTITEKKRKKKERISLNWKNKSKFILTAIRNP